MNDIDSIFTRHRHETRRRNLAVVARDYLTPEMLRITLGGGDLAGFTSLSPDDHVKLFVPDGAGGMAGRDYTPRHYDRAAGTLVIDFAVHGVGHEVGPATAWAVKAQVGDTVEIGGPRGSAVLSRPFDWFLLIGDETALPAMGRRIEELPAGVRVISLAAVADKDEEQVWVTAAAHEAHWAYRPASQADDPGALLEVLKGLGLPEGEGFVWIAGEAGVARALRDYVRDALGHPAAWIKAGGYWLKGDPGAHGGIGD